MLKEVRNNRNVLSKRRELLESESAICKNKLANVDRKLEEDEYINKSEQVMDASKMEMINLEIETLTNKKDVVYVDAFKVKEELLRAWDLRPQRNEHETSENDSDSNNGKQVTKIEKISNNKGYDNNGEYELEW